MERRTSVSQESESSYDNLQAKQRATVKWLLSKAYNSKVPENVREPFYKDNENQEHLKPQLVHSLSNAELYCMALSNIYTDPNYHNLNHWGILRALNNKGIYPDKRLTETVLIQTNPLKLSAHLSVMEAIMSLYAKEVATPDRVVAAVERFSPNKESVSLPSDHEAALVLWINEAVRALNLRISQEPNTDKEVRQFSCVKDLHELSDGAAMAALISFYCPEDLPHPAIVLSRVPSVSDCVKNLLLVYNFCARCLPSPVFHMMPEDVSFMRGSMRSNLVVFLADLFNLLEIHPAQCVRFDRGAAPLTEVQPLASSSPSISKRHSNGGNEVNGDEGSFVVHRGKSIPTLNSMLHQNNNGSSENVPAGKPSNWQDNRGKTYYAGRRSRRNSLSDESQLTVENFGGSQEHLHFLGRNPDKQVAVHVATRDPPAAQSPRLIAQENRNSTSVHNVLVESQSDEPIDTSRYTTTSRSNSVSSPSPSPYTPSPSSRGSTRAAADNASSAGLQNLLYDPPSPSPSPAPAPAPTPPDNTAATTKRMSTFATLPAANKSNTTTWQQQISGSSESLLSNRNADEGGVDTSQLMNIRMELEEKRRQIENEKRRAEAVISRQRQKMGKAAFFQAVSKGKGSLNSSPSSSSLKTPESDPGRESNSKEECEEADSLPQRPLSFQDISEVEQKWSENNGSHGPPFVDHRKSNNNTPETLIDQYQHSIAQIQEMQSDIQRLTQQQNTYHHPPQPLLHSFATTAVAAPQPITMNYFPPQPAPPVYQPVISCDIVHQPMQWSNMYQQGAPPQPAPPLNYTPSPPPHQNHIIPQHLMQHSASPSPPHHEMYHQQQHYSQQPQQMSQQQMSQQHYNHHMSQKPDSQSMYSNEQKPPSYFHQQHEQVDRLIRSNDPNHVNAIEPGERFYLHDPPSNTTSARKSWNTPSSPINFIVNSNGGRSHQQETTNTGSTRSLWNTRNDNKVNQISRSSSSNNLAFHNGGGKMRDEGAPTPPPRRSSQVHAPLPAPPVDEMAPQPISYIGADDDSDLSEGLSRMNITSGSRTYRIPSPTRPHLRNSLSSQGPVSLASLNISTPPTKPEKGFYISFDDDVAPKRPKPPLRAKKSPKKDRGLTQVVLDSYLNNIENQSSHLNDNGPPSLSSSPPSKPHVIHTSSPTPSNGKLATSPPPPPPGAIIIDPELVNPDPVTIDEMERKKERIMLQSLQRRQQQEEMKIRKELEAQRRREIDKRKADEKERKKSEMEQRRAAILEQHRIKKALEKAEMEGDKELLYSLKALQQQNSHSTPSNSGPPRLRGKPSTTRPRPKTIHIDNHSSSDLHDGMLTPARGNKGSSSNLSVFSNASSSNTNMRRDYYRGSQDCLAETRRTSSASFISDFGDDSRGTSPGRTVGRRGSYKTTSRGSSCDQDSMLYRGDTDSGLGLGTPSRRAPSPHHPSSPSGPGSLPLHRIRNRFDDTVSESGSDYCGPRLYKQPATKSNRGIILNAVEYCVFPGAVNRDAKNRVLDEIHRSEDTRHFLILFRDARCQFRALYAYNPDTEDGMSEVAKLYGTGPKLVTDRMFDQFFKYNSGGKSFTQIHTKHLTVTIDAFTIHNSLWQGKKVNLPNKRDMSLVI